MPLGKYFVLKSKLCGLALGIQGNSDNEGALAVLCENNPDEPHQVWYEDLATGTIRSKANDLCFDGNDKLRLRFYVPGEPNQQWKVDGEVVCHRLDKIKVFDIVEGRILPGTEVCVWTSHGGDNQKWEVDHLEARMFLIVSEHNNKVVEVAGANRNPGAKLVLRDQVGSFGTKNQQWYEDQSGFIRSVLNDFAPDGSRQEITMQPFDPTNPDRCWAIYGPTVFLKHKQDHVLDIIGSKTEHGPLVGMYKLHGGVNQRWFQKFIYG